MNWFKLHLKHKQHRTLSIELLLCLLLGLLLSACVSAPALDTEVVIHMPSDEVLTSDAQADAVLEVVALARAQIDWRFHQQEQICYSRFFVNACLLKAKKQRHDDAAQVQKSEVAANFFKRKSHVEEMDRALAEKYGEHTLPALEIAPANGMTDKKPS